MADIGKRIRELREQKGMSQQELADLVGYKSRASINKIELGRDLPIVKIARIADALGTTPEYIMGWDENEIPSDVSKELISYAYYDIKRESFEKVRKEAIKNSLAIGNQERADRVKRMKYDVPQVSSYLDKETFAKLHELTKEDMQEVESLINKLWEKQQLRNKIAEMQEQLKKMEEGN